MVRKRVKVVGIDKGRLNEDKLVDMVFRVEDAVRRYLEENLPKNIDYNFVINVEGDDTLSIAVEVEISSFDSSVLDKAKLIVDDALNLARRVWEEELESLKKGF